MNFIQRYTNELSKFRAAHWVVINDDTRGT